MAQTRLPRLANRVVRMTCGIQLSANRAVQTRLMCSSIDENNKSPKVPESHKVPESPRSSMFSSSKYCPYCGGEKYYKCLECDGCGKLYSDGMREYLCNECRGRGLAPCSMCGGSGINIL